MTSAPALAYVYKSVSDQERRPMGVPTRMAATVLVAPHRFELQQRPVPVPGDEDALVRVRACGVCGTDLKIIHDGMPDMPPYGEFIFGHEYAGDIVAVGRTVDEFKVGDRVVVEAHMGCRRCENCIRGLYTACLNYGNIKRGHRANGFTTNGGLAEYALNHVNTLYRVPDGVSYEESTVVMTSGSPLFGLENAGGYFAGETVAVLGPGPIGLMAIQLVKALGATRVILTGTRESRLALGRQLGADIVVDSRKSDPVAAVMDATQGTAADLVIDCAGADETFDQSIKMAKSGGKILLVGFYHGPVTADVSHAVRRNVTIYTERGEGGTSVGRALSLLAAGRLTAKPLITHQFPLSRVHEAFEVLEKRIGDPLKVVLNP